jgi:hypothetical protein
MSSMHKVHPGIEIYKQSRVDLDVQTEDRNKQGYLDSGAWNRALYAAITVDGRLILVMETAGDDRALDHQRHDTQDAAYWLEDMGDVVDGPAPGPSLSVHRVRQGIKRVRQALDRMIELYLDEDAQHEVAEMQDLVDAVEQAIAEHADDEVVHPERVR